MTRFWMGGSQEGFGLTELCVSVIMDSPFREGVQAYLESTYTCVAFWTGH